jgi:hypothetical protein
MASAPTSWCWGAFVGSQLTDQIVPWPDAVSGYRVTAHPGSRFAFRGLAPYLRPMPSKPVQTPPCGSLPPKSPKLRRPKFRAFR